ncbi:MAG: DUF1800 family protein [Lewinella sp.]
MASISPYTGTLNVRLAAHLLRRSCLRYTRWQIDLLTGMPTGDALDVLLQAPLPQTVTSPIDPNTDQPWIGIVDNTATSPRGAGRTYICGWWFNEAIQDETINHRMMLFLHNTFTVSHTKGASAHGENFFDHLALLRHFALGNFREFAVKMTLNNHMLIYLDNNLNIRTAPNENYGREFLELFTIGKENQTGVANYTEDDVIQAARVFSGFKVAPRTSAYIDPDTGIHAGRTVFSHHDINDKTFSSAFNGQTITAATNQSDMWRELDDFVDMVFAQRETARFFCRRMYRFFVRPTISPEVEQDIIEPMADTFIANNFEMLPVLRQLLHSEHFFDLDDSNANDETIGAIIKSPFDLLCHAVSFFNVALPDQLTEPTKFYRNFWLSSMRNTYLQAAGMEIFAPDSVAGYQAYYQNPSYDKSWFVSSTIVSRYKLGEMLVTGRRVLAAGTMGGVQLDSIAYLESDISNPGNANTVIDELLPYLLPELPDNGRRAYFLNDIFLEGLSPINWQFEWQNYIQTGSDTDVRIPTDQLIQVLLRTPEFQLL